MAEDHERDARPDEDYEPPEVEPIGTADELAKGNEGSVADGAPG